MCLIVTGHILDFVNWWSKWSRFFLVTLRRRPIESKLICISRSAHFAQRTQSSLTLWCFSFIQCLRCFFRTFGITNKIAAMKVSKLVYIGRYKIRWGMIRNLIFPSFFMKHPYVNFFRQWFYKGLSIRTLHVALIFVAKRLFRFVNAFQAWNTFVWLVLGWHVVCHICVQKLVCLHFF